MVTRVSALAAQELSQVVKAEVCTGGESHGGESQVEVELSSQVVKPEVCTGMELQVELSSQVGKAEVFKGVESKVELSSQVGKPEVCKGVVLLVAVRCLYRAMSKVSLEMIGDMIAMVRRDCEHRSGLVQWYKFEAIVWYLKMVEGG